MKPEHDKLVRPILFNATQAQTVRWQIAANRAGGNFSAWIREAAEARFAEQFPNFDPADHFPWDVTTPDVEAVRAEARRREAA